VLNQTQFYIFRNQGVTLSVNTDTVMALTTYYKYMNTGKQVFMGYLFSKHGFTCLNIHIAYKKESSIPRKCNSV